MAKADPRHLALLTMASSICFLAVSWDAWSITAQSTLGAFAAIVWSIGTIAAFNLLFIGALALIQGPGGKVSRSAAYSVWVAAAAQLAVAAGYANLGSLPLQGGIGYPQGQLVWLLVVLVGFGLGWLGTNWEKV